MGVPGAYSPACSASHVPGYVNHIKEFTNKGYNVFVTAVNDAFVTKAWGDEIAKDSGVSILLLYNIQITVYFTNKILSRFVLLLILLLISLNLLNCQSMLLHSLVVLETKDLS